MNVNKFFLGLIMLLFVFGSANAQNRGSTNLKKDSLLNNITDLNKRLKDASSKNISEGFSAPLKIDTVYANQLNDESFLPQRNKYGLLVLEPNWIPFAENVTFRDTVILDPVFLPVIFDGKILPDNLDFLSEKSDSTEEFRLIPRESTFALELDRMQHIRDMRKYYITNNPQRIRISTSNFVDSEKLKETAVVEKKNVFKELLTTDDAISISKPEVEKIQIKPVYWLKNGEHSLQINQNDISDNWHKGGNSNFSVINYHKLYQKYKKNKIIFENTFEWKLNVQRTPADEFHKLSIIDDYVRNSSTFSLTAFKKWSYNVNLKIETPLFHGYPVNSESRVRALFSPLKVNSGIGMKYSLEKISKKDKYKRFDLSLELSPISINYTLVADSLVDETRYGVEKGKKALLDFGSTVNANISYGFNRFSKFTSRIMYFTNYEKAIFEAENKFTMNLNRFLSASVYFYLRYDDGVSPDKKGKWGYFQYNETVGFGLSYSW
ncbi:DUF3078 domain-containing protein [Dysgonomonas reticulitermitis]